MGAPKGNKFAVGRGPGGGAPKGNQNALGHRKKERPPIEQIGAGRPSEFDRIEEGKALVEWAKDPRNLVFRAFAPYRGYSCETFHRWADEDPEFRKFYDIAKDIIGTRREMLYLESRHSSPYQKYATYYDAKLHEHERKDKAYEAELKERVTGKAADAVNNLLDCLSPSKDLIDESTTD